MTNERPRTPCPGRRFPSAGSLEEVTRRDQCSRALPMWSPE